MALHPSVYQVLVGVFASLGSLLLGYDLVRSSNAQGVLARNAATVH